MKLILAAELGKALLQRLSEAGEVLQEQGVPAGRTEVDLTGWATARLVSGEDGQPFKVLVCNTHPEHALDTTVHDGDVVEEHDILRPGYPRSLGSSKVMDCWEGDVATMFSIVPVQAQEPAEPS